MCGGFRRWGLLCIVVIICNTLAVSNKLELRKSSIVSRRVVECAYTIECGWRFKVYPPPQL